MSTHTSRKLAPAEFVDDDLKCCTIWLVVWTSRQYLLRRVTLESDVPSLEAILSAAGQRRVLSALVRVWDAILAASRTQLIVHSPKCAGLSLHEEALLSGLYALRRREAAGYADAMASILPADVACTLRPAMQALADAVYDLDAGHRRRRIDETRQSAQESADLRVVH